MKELVHDFASHPLLPAAVFVCLAVPASKRTEADFSESSLAQLNKRPLLEVVGHLQNRGLMEPEIGNRVLQAAGTFAQAFDQLRSHLPEVAQVTETDGRAVERLARVLMSSRLVGELLELLVPPALSYEKNKNGTVDLLQELQNLVRVLVGGAWSVLYPRGELSLRSDATAQFWMSCLYGGSPGEITRGFIGVFRKEHARRLQGLNQDHPRERGLKLQDPVSEYIDKSPERLGGIHDVLAVEVRGGLDQAFQKLARILSRLDLPWLVLQYYRSVVQESCKALSEMDGSVTPRENRFIHYLMHQVELISEEHRSMASDTVSGAARDQFEQLLAELDQLVGLEEVKKKVREIASFAKVQQMRLAQGLKPIPTSYHSVYMGNPGTGKTTVARLVGRIFRSLGVLKRGHLVECDRSALVGEYVGQTAPKTSAVIDSALDGILLIDEAYALAKEKPDYGHEAIEVLLKRMEDNRDRLVVIVTGYTAEMNQFIRSNPGLHSRFTRYIEFPDYSPSELCRIFGIMARQSHLRLSGTFRERLMHYLSEMHRNRTAQFGNARLVRNTFESAINAQALRLAQQGQFDPDSLSLLTCEDLGQLGEAACAAYRARGGGYQVRCSHCGAVYQWTTDLELQVAQCQQCAKLYDCEFGEPAAG